MPKLNLTRKDVHYTYAGIQPVSCDPKDPKGTRQIRIHDLSDEGFPNMLMLTGGPIMTYRIIGSDLADAVAKRISPSNSARELSYFPSDVTEKIQQEQSGHSTGPLGATILKRIIEEEQTGSLIDLFFRRSDMGWDLDRGRVKLEPVAKIMAEILGWDDAQLQEQIDSYHSYIEEIFPPHR
jgi:glycerol-3-phosphate dehydrogenase